VWDLTDGSCVTLPAADPARAVSGVAIGDDDGTPYAVTWSDDDDEIVVWDVAARTERCRIAPGFGMSRVACATAAGRPVAVASGAGVAVFDARTGTCLHAIASAPGWYASHLACGVSAGRAVVVAGCSDDVVRLWDLRTGRCLATHAVPDTVDAVVIAPDGGIVVCYQREIVVLDRTE
jgi:WD40 repeat protein